MPRFQSLVCLLLSAPIAVHAAEVTETIMTYEVSSLSADDLKLEMQAVGPSGYWGYTEWWVNWTGQCEVSVAVTYTLPEHASPQAMSDSLRESWDAMLIALNDHEFQHGQHGILAAEEIEAAECEYAHAILDVWSQADRDFDARTDHGRTEGVQF